MATSSRYFVFALGWPLFLCSCSSSQKPAPVAPPPQPVQPRAQAPSPPAPPAAQAPTMTQVHIDDAILKACGIQTDRAFFAFDSAKLDANEVKPLSDVAICFTTGPLKGKS